ncbi:MAG: adenosylcobalamin-dependent ribonucleoside-diphosphate reductase, partial [Alphaproteobacteria bacterium]|nr:adenosylcobalamin-dependent ribonucleoside-diphosphate reductase [Alphaproteobacteria bacterium]
MSQEPAFPAAISQHIWEQKYRFKADGAGGEPADGTALVSDQSLDDTFARVAKAAASVEKGGKKVRAKWAKRFHAALADFGFLPAGRILAGAGTKRQVTAFNCFVMGRIEDDLDHIFDSVREAALTLQQGGGIGHDFSTLRPKGALVKSIGADASGPVSFMDVWDSMCATIMSAGARRGAMMATLRVDHPDIEDFIAAKSDPTRLRNFNLSVLVPDAFMTAVAQDTAWDLQFDGTVYRTVQARDLWQKIMRATYDYAEPGVVFIDRINQKNNLNYCEVISATNPCGEQPLPPYGACLLGSINLTRFIKQPFTDNASLDRKAVAKRVALAVRFLDNMIEVSDTPLARQRSEASAKRRIGLGLTGLADALVALNVRYGSNQAQKLAKSWMTLIQNAAYEASANLAREKGAFPLYDARAMATRPNVTALKKATRARIAKHGLRNGCLTSIAPTGTISLFAGNISSGIEPVFDARYERVLRAADGRQKTLEIEDYACRQYRAFAGDEAALPPAFVSAVDLTPRQHLEMQAAVQAHVDSSISKTINCRADIPFETFQSIYRDAYDLGLKGCTTYRPNAVTGHVLHRLSDPEAAQAAVDTEVGLGARLVPSEPHSDDGMQPHDEAPNNDVIYVSKPLVRDASLSGYTYKLKWPESANALYVTI